MFIDHPQAFNKSLQTADDKYFADIYHIAKQKMFALGITHVSGGEHCTYQQSNLFFSYRKASHQVLHEPNLIAKTGRCVSAIYID